MNLLADEVPFPISIVILMWDEWSSELSGPYGDWLCWRWLFPHGPRPRTEIPPCSLLFKGSFRRWRDLNPRKEPTAWKTHQLMVHVRDIDRICRKLSCWHWIHVADCWHEPWTAHHSFDIKLLQWANAMQSWLWIKIVGLAFTFHIRSKNPHTREEECVWHMTQ